MYLVYILCSGLAQFQQHLVRNPDVMEHMLNTPYMQSLLANPDALRTLINMNPQMRQLLETNPELNHLINDPQFMQQSMEAFRNPAMMRELMRNTDRAMSNIESIPGGFGALRRLYNEVQAPLWEASVEGSGSYNKATADAIKSKYDSNSGSTGPNSEPMPNPWGGNAQGAAPSGGAPSTAGGADVPSWMSLFDPSAMAAMMQDPNM